MARGSAATRTGASDSRELACCITPTCSSPAASISRRRTCAARWRSASATTYSRPSSPRTTRRSERQWRSNTRCATMQCRGIARSSCRRKRSRAIRRGSSSRANRSSTPCSSPRRGSATPERASRCRWSTCSWTARIRNEAGSTRAVWEPNIVVAVEDDVYGIDGEFLVTQVTMTRDSAGGTRTQVTLTPPEAYDVKVPPKRKKPKGEGSRFDDHA
ncbi:phage baseplate assembly protein [Nannocystis pusilla]|uniref:phage baseplate assembly protein n=1 Tax=Nannocystis pusilla TaxID=889268 RepID=UPI003B836305